MAPGIVLDEIGEKGTSLRVLDPMAGSGTVLAVARAHGHLAIGFDLDPLAVLLASVWTRTIDANRLRDKATEVLDRAKAKFVQLPSRLAYPRGADRETREFITYWFDDFTRRQLTALAGAIGDVRERASRELLWCGFSRLIITKQAGASLAMDLSHSRPHKVFHKAPVKPFSRFLTAVEAVVANCPHPGGSPDGPPTLVKQGDARQLRLPDASVDVVLTSPPYLNAIDYIRCSRFSLVWMGYQMDELRKIRSKSVGAETSSAEARAAEWVRSLINKFRIAPGLSGRHYSLLSQYVWDMSHAVAEVSRVLRSGGRAVYVVGDSTVHGSFVRNSAIIVAVAQDHGLSLISRKSRSLPPNRRYLPPPKRRGSDAPMNGRMRQEVVMSFEKMAR